jgi:O-antigen/teichoic acid export membrane protein
VLIAVASASVAIITRSPALVLAVEAGISIVLAAAIFQRIAESHHLPIERLAALAWRTLPKVNWTAATVFLAVSLVASAVQYADRWFSASMLPAQQFAQYAFAAIAILIAQSAQSMINASLYPALSRRYAIEGEAVAFSASARASIALLAAAAVLCVPAYFVAQFAVSRFYAAYTPALDILPVLLAVSCLRVSDFWSSFLMICGHERQLLATQLVAGGGVCALWSGYIAARGGVVSILDFAWLALWLAVATYGGSAGAAWWSQRRVPVAKVAA